MRRTALAFAAASAGASGLALEILLVDCAGLSLGHGRSGAIGLSTFVAAWALGAYASGRSRVDASHALFRSGLLAAIVAWPAVRLVLWAGGAAHSGALATGGTIVAIAVVGLLQGTFLAPLARAFRGEVSWLLAANFSGSVAGAYGIADLVVGAHGRLAATLAAGALAGAAGLVGGLVARGASPPEPERARDPGSPSWGAAATIVAISTAWVVSLEWIGLRLGVLWLGGMQPALRAVLVASLAALAVGAAIVPTIVPRGRTGVLATLLFAAPAGVWPLVAARAIRALVPEGSPDLVTALVLVGPSLVPLGGLVAVLHRAMPLESGERLGRLLLHEAWGALLGLPLVHFLVVPHLGLTGALALLELGGAVAILVLLRGFPRTALAGALLPAGLAAWAWLQAPPALDSPPLSNPAFIVRSFQEDRDFAVTVVDDGLVGERTLLTDGFRAAGTGSAYSYMRVLGHLPVLLSEHPRRVAVLALGTGTSVGAVALHPEVARIDVLEISRAVVLAAPWFAEKNRGALAEGLPALEDDSDGNARVVVRLGDGRALLAASPAAFDVITMEPLLPDSPFGVYLYTREFYGRARAALAPEGLLCQWVPPHALEPRSFEAVLDAFATAFPWSSVWVFGTQAILVGGERAPSLDPDRFHAAGDLAASLEELGLDTPAGLVSRYVADGTRVRGAVRALTDDDPWIVYCPRRKGPVLLGDLATNLAFLRQHAQRPPASWSIVLGEGAERAIEGLSSVRAAREAHALAEARLRGCVIEVPGVPDLAESLAHARRLVPGEPELVDLEEEIAFVNEIRAGVSWLASDRTREGAVLALPHLLNAATAKRERADVHLYTAVALERLGEAPASRAALSTALRICPGIGRTPEGRRARDLGISDPSWAEVEVCAKAAAREWKP